MRTEVPEGAELGRVSPKPGVDLAAAGVKPGSPREFVERVKNALEGYFIDDIQGCTGLARKLNENRITNFVGGRWTATLVKIFADMYI